MTIKEEIDREIRRHEKKKITKKKPQRRRKKRESDDNLLERIWLNTVDESHADFLSLSPSNASLAVRSLCATPSSGTRHSISPTYATVCTSNTSQTRSNEKKNVGHRASSPPMNLVMRHDYDDESVMSRPTHPGSTLTFNDDATVVSGITASTIVTRRKDIPGMKAKQPQELAENLSLEEAFLDAEIQHEKEQQSKAEMYRKLYGLKGASNRISDSVNLFSAENSNSTIASSRSKFSQWSPESNDNASVSHRGPVTSNTMLMRSNSPSTTSSPVQTSSTPPRGTLSRSHSDRSSPIPPLPRPASSPKRGRLTPTKSSPLLSASPKREKISQSYSDYLKKHTKMQSAPRKRTSTDSYTGADFGMI
jgi:hypothetical protein